MEDPGPREPLAPASGDGIRPGIQNDRTTVVKTVGTAAVVEERDRTDVRPIVKLAQWAAVALEPHLVELHAAILELHGAADKEPRHMARIAAQGIVVLRAHEDHRG